MNETIAEQGPQLSEREKWEQERAYKERELLLREREYELKARETQLKEKEQKDSGWKRPLVVAIIAAAVAALGNAAVALTVGLMQRQLEEEKAEQQRILEMIKTGNTETAAKNLEFLVKVGLVTNKIQRDKLAEFLKTRQPGEGPALPIVGMRESRSLSYHPVNIQAGERAVRVRFRETNRNPKTFSGNRGNFTVNGKEVEYADEGVFETVLSLSAKSQELTLRGRSLVGEYVEITITEYDFSEAEVGTKVFKEPVKNGTISLVHHTQELDVEKMRKESRPRSTSKSGVR